jgi:hypothetical protein
MGTDDQWSEVVFVAVILGGAMMVWMSYRRKNTGVFPIFAWWNLAIWGLLGTSFGIVIVFREEAFHWPLVGILAGTFFGGLALALAVKGQYRRA